MNTIIKTILYSKISPLFKAAKESETSIVPVPSSGLKSAGHLIITGFISLLIGISCSERSGYTDPLSPEEALESFHLHEDFEIEIFATEPLVVDPVEMVFDEYGNIFVMEMSDYPFKPRDLSDDEVVGEVSQYPFHSEVLEAGGRIRMLFDSNNDGRIDSSAVFADGISEGTSILPWDGGLLVSSAPDILYLKDTTGDMRADTKEVLFSGFSTANVQAQITSLRYGIDNWIYASNDGRPGQITFARNPDTPAVSVAGADFRFRLDRGEFEAATGVGRVGRTINDWGHRFMTAAVPHIRHVVIPHRYLQRNPHLPSVSAIDNINDHGRRMFQLTPAPYWRAERSARRQQEYDEAGLDRFEDVKGYFTGATGGTIYAGDAFPEEYYGNVFTGEHAGNLIHRDVLHQREDHPTYLASRHESELDREFLASTDPWFRPTTFTAGPDGYLYVVDMYRQHTEHPIAIPEDLKEDPYLDFTQGLDLGRIYRILPKGSGSPGRLSTELADMPSLGNMESGELVGYLSHPNRWWRLQAQRLLVERQDRSIVSQLHVLLDEHEDPKTRLHSLYVLEGLEALNPELVERAMRDEHPGVREHGMILSESYPALLPRLLEGTSDPANRVAFQASLSVGEFSGPQVLSALAGVMERHGEDSWFQTAVLSSEAGSSGGMLEELLDRGFFSGEVASWKTRFVGQLSSMIGSRNMPEEVVSSLELVSGLDSGSKQAWQHTVVEGLTEGLKKHEESDAGLAEVLQQVEDLSGDRDNSRAFELLKEYYAVGM